MLDVYSPLKLKKKKKVVLPSRSRRRRVSGRCVEAVLHPTRSNKLRERGYRSDLRQGTESNNCHVYIVLNKACCPVCSVKYSSRKGRGNRIGNRRRNLIQEKDDST